MQRADDTRNSFSGNAGAVVQAGGIHGGLHLHRSGEPVLPVPRQLPLDVPDFTGRADDLRRLDGFLAAGRAVAVAVVTGPPGVGKTTLAVHWAHRGSPRFPDGQLYVDLRGFDPTAPVPAHQALDSFVRALGVAPERIPGPLDETAALYRSLLADRRVLVVLDNAVDVGQVRPLLPGSATCAVVVTSRNRLAGLVAGAGARRVVLDVLPPAESVALLGAAAGAERLAAEPEAAGELARLCGHLPLALGIAGERVARSAHWTVSDLVGEFAAEQHRLDLLATGSGSAGFADDGAATSTPATSTPAATTSTTADDGAGAVRAVFSWSYRKLPAGVARVFRGLGRHPGPEFGVPAAAELAGVPESEARSALEALVDANLLVEVDRGRYGFHDLLRLYAVERAGAEETAADGAAAVRRLLEWYLRVADAADHLLTRRSYCVPLDHRGADVPPAPFTDHRGAGAWCDREHVNLMAAIRLAADRGEHSLAWRLPVALWGFFFLRKHWRDWITALTTGLASARAIGDRRGEAWTLHSLREAHFSMHRTGEAPEYGRQALDLFREVGDGWGIREALSNLGYAHRLQGRPDEALAHLDEALALWRRGDSRWGQAWTLHSLGETYLDLGRWDEAEQVLREALDLFGDIGHRQAEGFARGGIGHVHLGRGSSEAAVAEFRRAAALHEEVGDRWSAVRTLTGLGRALRATGETAAALNCWREALAVCEDLNDPVTAAGIRALLGP
ncbi:tetratricopeptide repeat protein [Saccharothrix sp. BKS2]|uniref:ATP-binding protein n=1 Tax=Saccharothrix sp. BKS2 TaxID=3064400 RepID=UPI0039E9D4AF